MMYAMKYKQPIIFKLWPAILLVLESGLPGVAWGQSPCDPTPTAGTPLVLAELQVWHGLASHVPGFSGAFWLPEARAYDSSDPALIGGQIAAAKALGIDGFVIDWYGPSVEGLANQVDRAFMDGATATLFTKAEEAGDFCLALLYDEGTMPQAGLASADFMERATLDLSYADGQYLSSPAYLKLAGKPALFVFPFPDVDPHLDWTLLRDALSGHQVTLLDKDPDPGDPAHDAAFDGFFAWVQPGAGGWDPFGLEWGEDYLRWFYPTLGSVDYSGKLAVGGVWPGFDDSLASWGADRFMSRAEGDVYTRTWNLATEHGAEIVLIATWNDYEEGTDIEHGVRMRVDMEAVLPEILMRSSPLEVTWDPARGAGVLQVYENGVLIHEEQALPPVVLTLTSGTAYELKLWTGDPSPLVRTVKIRRQDPHPALLFVDGFESGDLSRWSAPSP